MLKTYAFLILCFLPLAITSQTEEMDSLYTVWLNESQNFAYDEQIDALHQLGKIIKNDDPDSSIILFKKGVEFAIAHNDRFNEAFFLSRIGGSYYIKGIYDKSLEYFSNALKIWTDIESEEGIMRGLNNVAIIYHMVGEEEKAISNHKESVKMCISLNDSSMLALNYLNLALIYNDLNKYDSALFYVNRSKNIFKEKGNNDMLMKGIIQEGYIYLNQKNYQKAVDCFAKPLNNEEYNNEWEKCYAIVGMASAEQKLGNVDLSIELGLKGLEKAEEINALWDIMYSKQILSEAYAAKGDYERGYQYYKEFKTISDSIFNEENKNKINYLRLKQKEYEYLLLEDKNQFQQESIKRKNNLLIILLLTVAIVLLITVALFRFNLVKSKLNNQLKQKNDEIARQNEELRQLNNGKDTFLKIIGHDLKGPVGLVVSFIDLVISNYDDLTVEEKKEYLKLSKSSALNAIDLLTNLLDWVKSQTSLTSVYKTNTNVCDLINRVYAMLKSTIEIKGINYANNVDKNLMATVDANIMIVVLRNLITNAIKFTDQGGHITVDSKKSETELLLSITDTGVGMTKQQVESLFNVNEPKSTAGTDNEKGIGIGLLLCKDLIEKQGGSIWVESEPDVGSTFYISIPD